jgi:hypothetical protein
MQKQAIEIISSVEQNLWAAMQQAWDEAHTQSSKRLQSTSFNEQLPAKDYYTSSSIRTLCFVE